MTDILVTGASGKMGGMSAATIAAQPDFRLVALVDVKGGASEGDAPCFASVDHALALTSPDAALEFSVPAAVFDNARALLEAGVPTVVGTTGLTDAQVEELAAAAAKANVGLVVVPNFAALASSYYGQAEIIELHESGKLDAPSGTSLRTARLMAEAPGSALRDAPGDQPSRGLAADRVRIHSVRLPGVVAHQEVLFGGEDEVLTLRHDSLSRRSFMTGVLLALRRVTSLKETVVGLENLLD